MTEDGDMKVQCDHHSCRESKPMGEAGRLMGSEGSSCYVEME